MYDPIEDSGAEIPNQRMTIKSIVAKIGEDQSGELQGRRHDYSNLQNGTAPEEPATRRKKFNKKITMNTSLVNRISQ
jgi:hypothetical protein